MLQLLFQIYFSIMMEVMTTFLIMFFSIDINWKLGFIGRNGRGKTTFLNLLMGKYEYRGNISANYILIIFLLKSKIKVKPLMK